MSDLSDIQAKISGTLALDEGGEVAVANLFAFSERITHASAENATTNVANTKVFVNPYPYPLRVMAANYNPTGAGLTADNTNFATINVLTDDAAGGTPAIALTAVTTLNTSVTGATGNWAQNVNENFAVLNAAAQAVPVGGVVWFNVVKSGAGLDIPAGELTVLFGKI